MSSFNIDLYDMDRDTADNMDRDTAVKGTLDWCNSVRALDGKPPLDELPKGKRYDSTSCPCGRATGYYISSRGAHTGSGLTQDTLAVVGTPALYRFVLDFDYGDYPELIDYS